MSKRKPTRGDTAPPQDAAPQLPPAAPPKPRKALFAVLCVAFAAWVGFLTTLYFKTVHGKQDPHAHRVIEGVEHNADRGTSREVVPEKATE
jgi:hypothetical protein